MISPGEVSKLEMAKLIIEEVQAASDWPLRRHLDAIIELVTRCITQTEAYTAIRQAWLTMARSLIDRAVKL